jgi:hypothetical protein
MHIAYSQVDVRFKQYALGRVSVGPLRALSPAERVACMNAAPCAVFARVADRFITQTALKYTSLSLRWNGRAGPHTAAGWQRPASGAGPGASGAGPRRSRLVPMVYGLTGADHRGPQRERSRGR